MRVTNNWWDKTTLAAVNATFQNTSALVINANPFLTTAPVLMDPCFGNDPRLLQALQIEYLHYDAFNSPVAATNQAGTVLWQEHYQPYGESRVNADPNPTVNYTGHALDRDSGLIYAGARYMDPVVGRFMSVDPVEFVESNPLSFNRYAYANNSPYAFYDPDGQSAVTLLGGVVYEAGQALQGNGFDTSRLAGALADGYNGEGEGFASAAVGDALAFGGGALGLAAKAANLARGAEAAGAATSFASSLNLGKQLASLEQLGEKGKIIAGQGSTKAFRDAARVASEYGGKASGWVKKSSSPYTAKDGRKFETHWVENLSSGQRVEQKTIVEKYLSTK